MKIVLNLTRFASVPLFLLAIAPTPLHAYCSRGLSFDYEGAVNAEFKFLLCLHNEQVESLNNATTARSNLRETDQNLFEILRDQAELISYLEARVAQLERAMGNLATDK